MNMFDIMTFINLLVLLFAFYRLLRTVFYFIVAKHLTNLCFGFIAVVILGILGQIHSLMLPNQQWIFKFFSLFVGILAINFSKNVRVGKK